MQKTGIFVGSFDPFTIGHDSVVRRAVQLFDRLVIGVGVNEHKRYMLTAWASMARLAGVPMETICKCMGHHSERTTQIYLKEFDTDTMHDANDQVISLLEGD